MKYKMSPEEKKYLDSYDITQYDRPSVATDIAVFSVMDYERDDNYRKDTHQKLNILLIKRANYPYKDCWALPGGFCVKNEDVEETAYRELKEETKIEDAYLEPFGIFGAKDRDPRGWIISNAFLTLIDGQKYKVRAGSDAWQAEWFAIEVEKKTKYTNKDNKEDIESVNEYTISLKNKELDISAIVSEKKVIKNYREKTSYEIVSCNGIGFDHAIIILKAYKRLQYRTENEISIVFDLMPEYFTLAQLQNAFEVILDKKLLVANFRRKLADYVVETERIVTGVGHRPAKLFARNMEKISEER